MRFLCLCAGGGGCRGQRERGDGGKESGLQAPGPSPVPNHEECAAQGNGHTRDLQRNLPPSPLAGFLRLGPWPCRSPTCTSSRARQCCRRLRTTYTSRRPNLTAPSRRSSHAMACSHTADCDQCCLLCCLGGPGDGMDRPATPGTGTDRRCCHRSSCHSPRWRTPPLGHGSHMVAPRPTVPII